ncbi:Tubulin polyglutamylase ttll4 [Podochytrium sp. JEL0797]|nr:Tubulin polyglutamylase ttll4 [Podochytrium sp. JEL0797]
MSTTTSLRHNDKKRESTKNTRPPLQPQKVADAKYQRSSKTVVESSKTVSLKTALQKTFGKKQDPKISLHGRRYGLEGFDYGNQEAERASSTETLLQNEPEEEEEEALADSETDDGAGEESEDESDLENDDEEEQEISDFDSSGEYDEDGEEEELEDEDGSGYIHHSISEGEGEEQPGIRNWDHNPRANKRHVEKRSNRSGSAQKYGIAVMIDDDTIDSNRLGAGGAWRSKPAIVPSLFDDVTAIPSELKEAMKWKICKFTPRTMQLDFLPTTYFLPSQRRRLKLAFNSHPTWIIKPPASARGIGIRVANKWKDIPQRKEVIVSKLVST